MKVQRFGRKHRSAQLPDTPFAGKKCQRTTFAKLEVPAASQFL
jgi:hypothetical protein